MATSAISPLLIGRAALLKPLRELQAFDSSGSPYIGVELVEGNSPRFYRSSNFGSIQSKEYGIAPKTYVALAHFVECVKTSIEDMLELRLSENGILGLHGVNLEDDSESHVHTVSAGQAGLKRHDVGERKVTVEPSMFSGIDLKLFHTVTPPVISGGKLMLVLDKGTVFWKGPESMAAIHLFPRESFLRAVSGGVSVEDIHLTENGYWCATVGDMVTYIKGHVVGQHIFNQYDVPGTEVARLRRSRLMDGLYGISSKLEDSTKIEIDPKQGILAKDKLGAPHRASLDPGAWTRFTLFSKTAKIVADVLSQTTEDSVVVYTVPSSDGSGTVMRFSCGPVDVVFRSF